MVGGHHRGPSRDHFDGTEFRNHDSQAITNRPFSDLLRRVTDEAIDAPIRALRDALAVRGIDAERFRALKPGETWHIAAAPARAAAASA